MPRSLSFASDSDSSIIGQLEVSQREYYRVLSGRIDANQLTPNEPILVEFYKDDILLERANVFPPRLMDLSNTPLSLR